MIFKIFIIISLISLLFLAFGQQKSTSFPELVVKKDSSTGEPRTNIIHNIHFDSADSLVILGSQEQRLQVRTVGASEDIVIFGGSYIDIKAAQWIRDREYLVSISPLQLFIWDWRHQKKIKEIKINTIDPVPFTCHTNGTCVWEEIEDQGKVIRVQNLIDNTGNLKLQLKNDTALDIDISSDGKLLASAVNHSTIRLWSLLNGRELPALELEGSSDETLHSNNIKNLFSLIPKLVSPTPGFATVVRFSPDHKFLAAAGEFAIHVFNLDWPGKPVLLRGHKGLITSLAFDNSSERLFSTGEDGSIRVWEPKKSNQGITIAQLSRPPTKLILHPNHQIIAASFASGDVEMWNVKEQKLLVTLTFLPEKKGWIAFTPNGLFEASEGAWQYAAWRFQNKSNLPIEYFFRKFYRPGLIADLIEQKEVTPPSPIDPSALDVPVPTIKIKDVETHPASAELVPGGDIRRIPESIRFRIEARPGTNGGGVFDLGLTHNGTVVRKWPGKLSLRAGVAVQEVELEMHPADNRVTAFAFNDKGVRSVETKDAVWERKMKGWGYAVPQRTLYVVAIGVGTYRNSRFNLKFPAADAGLVEQALTIPESDLWKMYRRLSDWEFKQTLEGLSGGKRDEMPAQMPARVKLIKIINEQATREHILQALQNTVKSAGTNDAVIIFYSGHGVSDGYDYYLFPFDMGIPSEPGKIQNKEIRAVASTLISDNDLEKVLLPLNVAYSALIVDACQSGLVLEGSENRGPMNLTGLARLAYEKGMHMLAASEAQQPAQELDQLGHSVLTYALFYEGFLKRKADFRPIDGRIEVKEWLTYGAGRVRKLLGEIARTKGAVQNKADTVQSARFVPRRMPEAAPLVLYVGEKKP